jgi:hypothetical protein
MEVAMRERKSLNSMCNSLRSQWGRRNILNNVEGKPGEELYDGR